MTTDDTALLYGQVLAVHLDGVALGAATILSSYVPGTSQKRRDDVAAALCDQLVNNPATLAKMLKNIQDRLSNPDQSGETA